MRIYIDEAGNFLPPTSQQSSFSLVLALVVPSSCETELFYEFLRLRDSWPENDIEIKGSKLDEGQAAQVIDLLARFDVLVHFVSLDMAMHGVAVVDEFKSYQAEAITANLTREHYPPIVCQLAHLQRAMVKMPNQLFVQAEVTINLVLKILRYATLYYAQRDPTEIGDIAWTIDRKGRALTEMEEMWSTLITPMSESHFMRDPLIFLQGGDYSHFNRRYETDVTRDPEMANHVEWAYNTYGKEARPDKNTVVNATLLFTEQQKFLDSVDSLGLQLADMLASIIRRALNNRLQKRGWEHFGKLVVYSPDPGWFIALRRSQPGPSGEPLDNPQVAEVWGALNRFSKQMLIKGDRRKDENGNQVAGKNA